MIWFPGWGSAETASWWSGFYFWFGLTALFCVGLSAVLSYRYSLRKDELIFQATNQHLLAYRSQQNSYQLQLAAAHKRHLTELQRRTLVAALAEFSGQSVQFRSVEGDAESQSYLGEFVSVITSANWTFDANNDIQIGAMVPPPRGVQVTMNESEAREGRIPDAVKAFVAALHMLGITSDNTIYLSAGVPAGTIDVDIGPR